MLEICVQVPFVLHARLFCGSRSYIHNTHTIIKHNRGHCRWAYFVKTTIQSISMYLSINSLTSSYSERFSSHNYHLKVFSPTTTQRYHGQLTVTQFTAKSTTDPGFKKQATEWDWKTPDQMGSLLAAVIHCALFNRLTDRLFYLFRRPVRTQLMCKNTERPKTLSSHDCSGSVHSCWLICKPTWGRRRRPSSHVTPSKINKLQLPVAVCKQTLYSLLAPPPCLN